MPVQNRRYFIMRHNAEQEHAIAEQESLARQNSNTTRTNSGLNTYAKLEQQNNRRR